MLYVSFRARLTVNLVVFYSYNVCPTLHIRLPGTSLTSETTSSSRIVSLGDNSCKIIGRTTRLWVDWLSLEINVTSRRRGRHSQECK